MGTCRRLLAPALRCTPCPGVPWAWGAAGTGGVHPAAIRVWSRETAMEDLAATPCQDHRLPQPWGSLSGHRVPFVPPPRPPEPRCGALASPNPAPTANPA